MNKLVTMAVMNKLAPQHKKPGLEVPQVGEHLHNKWEALSSISVPEKSE
jgi:hypothetical protein